MYKVRALYRKYRSAVLSTAILLLAFTVFFAGIVPGARAIITVLSDAGTASSQVAALSTKYQFLRGLDEATLRRNLNLLLTALPGDKSVPSILSTIDGVAAESGISVQGFEIASVGPTASGSAARQTVEERKIGSYLIPYSLVFLATPEETRKFFSAVTAVRRLSRVKNFTLTVRDPETYYIHTELETFYQPLAAVIGSINAPLSPLTEQESTFLETLGKYPLMSQYAPAVETGSVGGVTRNPFQ
ncbi:type 4a pilus biogenesis protein PilO [Patescibacteria group bacterium]|nr:type 4a pilus biogenesis protein PilO [Patescibacteria group bacterium]